MRLMHIHFQKSIAELHEYNTFNFLQTKSLSKEKKIKIKIILPKLSSGFVKFSHNKTPVEELQGFIFKNPNHCS